MKIIVAMDSYKGSMTSNELNDVIGDTLNKEINDLELVKIPISDGGEGFIETYCDETDFEEIIIKAHNPLMEKIEVSYLFNNAEKLAIVESAKIIGLDKVNQLLPFKASSFGLGEVINHAIKRGAQEVIVGLGGSATNDAGIGMLRALSYEFLNKNNEIMNASISNIKDTATVRLENDYLPEVKFKAITDVKNVFTGKDGASNIFGPQKGLLQNEVEDMDQNFDHFNSIIKDKTGVDLSITEGAGAAGGISGVMHAFFNAEIKSGIEYILDKAHFDEQCKGTDFIITGEGRIDHQSFYGKVIQGISNRAKSHHIPVIALGGSVDSSSLIEKNDVYPYIFSILNRPISLEAAIGKESTIENLNFTVKNLARLLKRFQLQRH